MGPHGWWYLARASGIVAWALVSASVITGLLVSTRLTNGRPTPAWALDLHRFLSGAGVVFTGLHLAGLVADGYVHVGAVDLFVPFATSWRPSAVALGVAALYLLVAIEATSLLMRKLPRRLWRSVHVTSFVLFWLATFHFLLAGTDASAAIARVAADVVLATVVFLTLVRVLSPRRRAAPRRSATPVS
jgi:predicted ferric reductase